MRHVSALPASTPHRHSVGGVGVTLADQGIQAGGQGIIQGFPKQAGVEEMFFNGFSVGTNPFSVAQVNTTYDLQDSVSRTVGKP
jgi:hypothetical protein